jgi:hypothetical protein
MVFGSFINANKVGVVYIRKILQKYMGTLSIISYLFYLKYSLKMPYTLAPQNTKAFENLERDFFFSEIGLCSMPLPSSCDSSLTSQKITST